MSAGGCFRRLNWSGGGPTARVAGHFIGMWTRRSSAAAGLLARYRERARARERIRKARLAEANRQPEQGRRRPSSAAGTTAPGAAAAAPPEPANKGEGEGHSFLFWRVFLTRTGFRSA